MNASKNGRASKGQRTFKIAPLTRAVRSGLSISVALLALGGSGAAMAGDHCFTPTTGAAICTDAKGIFVQDTTPLDDLVSPWSDAPPNSVMPSFGLVADDATAHGRAGWTQFGDINSVLTSESDVSTVATFADDAVVASSVSALYDVTVVNNVAIYAADAGAADVIAWNVYANTGNLSVDNQGAGTVTAQANDGSAIALLATAYGTLAVTNEGAITASSVNGIAAGVVAQAYGDASLTNSGSIAATSTNYQAVGVNLSSVYGVATVTNSGSITASGGQDQAIGIGAYGGLGVAVDNTGSVGVASSGGSAIAIDARTYDGNANASNSGSIKSTTSSTYTAIGVYASSANGQAGITNSGFVQSLTYNVGPAVGLEAYAANGASITNSGYVLGGSYQGSGTGLLASATTGDANVTNSASG
ncbi:MAG: hypothetical protein JWL98_258, partial [Xanthomonadaceae bacterium]|nr:hypothetical protein [Xanthomonadaceae bacterium]